MTTIFLASWTQRFTHPFPGESGEHRLTQHVSEVEFDALRADPSTWDLRGVELPDLLAELSADQMNWLQGGQGWPSDAPRSGRTDEEELAEYVVALLPPEDGGSLHADDPVESEQALLRAAAAGVLSWRDRQLFVADHPFPLLRADGMVVSLTHRGLLVENPDGSSVNRITITERGRYVLAGGGELDVACGGITERTGVPLILVWLVGCALLGLAAWVALGGWRF